MFDRIWLCKHRFAIKRDGKGNNMKQSYSGSERYGYRSSNAIPSGIDVMSCVQGNTARVRDFYSAGETADRSCVVFEFRSNGRTVESARSQEINTSVRKRAHARRKAARARARKVRNFRILLCGALLVMMLSLGGIASRAQSRKAPDAYKYYDTITVGYQENLLDIIERYDDRNYYETQKDYVEELCAINNLGFDGTSYPSVTPGTHLIVPYYSTELK